jgi:hypothetical protein
MRNLLAASRGDGQPQITRGCLKILPSTTGGQYLAFLFVPSKPNPLASSHQLKPHPSIGLESLKFSMSIHTLV